MDEIKNVLFSVFGMPVTYYALFVVLALALGLLFLLAEQKRAGLRGDTTEIFALLALPLGLIGARLFYCLCRLNLYLEMGLINILRLWDGGYALWGAVGGAVAAAQSRSPVKPGAVVLFAALFLFNLFHYLRSMGGGIGFY